MIWTVTELIEIVTGITGAHIAAVAARDYSFGRIGHSVAGAAAGGLSGCVLQMFTGFFSESRPFEQMAGHILAGATAGGILMLAIGFAKHSIDAHRVSKR
jgi:hypothetical protein